MAVGAMPWGQSLSVGLTADPALVPDAELLAAEMRAAFTTGQLGAGKRLTIVRHQAGRATDASAIRADVDRARRGPAICPAHARDILQKQCP